MKKIQRLDEDTINRIAAGEVVQRPAAVVKELIENCLDAGSSTISVTCKGGGLDFLQVQDNGHGIPKESLSIVCERFTTSKITKFEDLETVSTFGFRGEALASITHVAQVTITTMTAGEKCAFKAKYLDGKLVPIRPGDKAEPKPCAGVCGTTIIVEDLFYNMITRRQAFRNPQEEFQRILDVLTKHSIHYPHVSFVCKKADKRESMASLKTNQDSTTLENIRLIYGPALARELLEFQVSSTSKPSESDVQNENETMEFDVHGYISNANYSCKKSTFVLFINNRLVSCQAIQRCVESVYKPYLPKHMHPFVYLAVTMPPHHLDVNVHPTKKEVHFLFESDLLGLLHDEMTCKLEGANDSRVFLTQSLLTVGGSSQFTSLSNKSSSLDAKFDISSMRNPGQLDDSGKNTECTASGTMTGSKRSGNNSNVAAHKFVRTDPSLQSIDRFFKKKNDDKGMSIPTADILKDNVLHADEHVSSPKLSQAPVTSEEISDNYSYSKMSNYESTPYDYSSLRSLLKQIDDENEPSLQELLRRHSLVGVIDDVFLLVQSGTQLVLVDHSVLTFHLFRQLSLRRFGIMPAVSLTQPVNVEEYILFALDTEEDHGSAGKAESKAEIAMALCELLKSKSQMLKEYFKVGFTIDLDTLYLVNLPELLSGHRPSPEALPQFLLRLGLEVDWDDECACFEGISRELALFYCALPTPSVESRDVKDNVPDVDKHSTEKSFQTEMDNIDESDKATEISDLSLGTVVDSSLSPEARSLLLNLLVPAFKVYMCPPKPLATDGSFVVIAALEQLYKVFERC